MDELMILEKTDHPHITRVFEIFENKKNYYVVMELVKGGDLLAKVIANAKNNNGKGFTEAHVKMIIYQVMLALNYMHK